MSDLGFDGRELTVAFGRWEALMTGSRVVTVPTVAINAVRVEPDWTSEVLGVRVGLVISGYRKLGRFTHPTGTRRLVAMTRGFPLLRVGLDRTTVDVGFDELLLSSSDAEALAVRIRQAVPA